MSLPLPILSKPETQNTSFMGEPAKNAYHHHCLGRDFTSTKRLSFGAFLNRWPQLFPPPLQGIVSPQDPHWGFPACHQKWGCQVQWMSFDLTNQGITTKSKDLIKKCCFGYSWRRFSRVDIPWWFIVTVKRETDPLSTFLKFHHGERVFCEFGD